MVLDALRGFCGETPWNSTLVEDSWEPNVSQCVQHTVLVWLPCAFLWLGTPLALWGLRGSSGPSLPLGRLPAARLVGFACRVTPLGRLWTIEAGSTLLTGLALLNFFYGAGEAGRAPVWLIYPLLLALAFMTVTLLTLAQLRHGVRTSGLVWIFWLLLAVLGIPELKYLYEHNGTKDGSFRLVEYQLRYLVVVAELVLCFFVDAPREEEEAKGGKRPCPEFRSSFPNQLSFWWLTSLVVQAWRRPLVSDDLADLNDRDKSRRLLQAWEYVWQPRVARYRAEVEKSAEPEKVKQPSIVYSLFLISRGLFLPAVLLKFLYDGMQFVSPMILKQLIGFVEAKGAPQWQGFFWAALLFAVAETQSLIAGQYFQRMMALGMQWRAALTTAVFNKSLKLSSASRRDTTVGEIVNLMAVDTNRFQQIANFICLLWSAPFQILLSMVFLWEELGPAVLAGLAVLVLILPINFALMAKQRVWNVHQMQYKDDRLKLMNEVLGGIKVLKLYAWEPSFERILADVRRKEIATLRKMQILNAFISFMWQVAPFLVAAVTFGTFVAVDPVHNVLTPSKAFVSLSLLNILQFPMTMLPNIASGLIQVMVSNKRLRRFLISQELDGEVVERRGKSRSRPAVHIRRATFAWEGGEKAEEADADGEAKARPPSQATLRDIDLSVPRGSLVAVVGSVGAGKSSLVSAILGEMDKREGSVKVHGRVGYVPQQAWIQNMSLKDNVLFGRAERRELYDRVIDACALKSDLAMLAAGDQTEIGEKGINLSGGQKQRVSLARAVYAEPDVVLLDDPLSAVDSHVGKHIFDQVIGPQGLLKDKTRLLVTHGISFLKHTDRVVVLSEGRVTESGTYKELLRRGGDFAAFLQKNLLENAETSAEVDAGVLADLEAADPSIAARLHQQLSKLSSVSPQHSHQPTPQQPSALSRRTSQRRRSDSRHISDSDFRSRAGSILRIISESSPDVKPLNFDAEEWSETKEEDALSAKSVHAEPKDASKLVEAEKAETGQVKMTVYMDYLRAIGVWLFAGYVALWVVGAALQVGSNVWLAGWSEDAVTLATNPNASVPSVGARLGVYAALGFSRGLLVLIAAGLVALGFTWASETLHRNLLHALLRSPSAFFDTTPLGRIINRCGKDIDVIDNLLPMSLRSWVSCVISVFSTLAVIMTATPIFGVVIVPLAVVYLLVLRFYVTTSRQLKRLESVSRSPIYSHFQETIQGSAVIRAYGAEERFRADCQARLDTNLQCYYPNMVSNRWLAIRLEMTGNLIVFFAALFAVLGKSSGLTAGLVGLSVSYALQVTGTLNWAVRQTSELETNVVAVERVKEYAGNQQEAAWDSNADHKPPSDWPAQGQVTLIDLATRYRPGLDLVIKGITAHIEPGEKVGIVGRTGAGKSSLTLALFRIIEPAGGKILIDGRDVAEMGLHDLRSSLTIIPQDPVLFSGTLRMNLDPMEEGTDAELWEALETAGLKDFAAGTALGLLHPVAEGGENLSVGQRQLLCLARALLRRTKILILDEATAAVDLDTDAVIQETIREKFAGSTILTIAHRLNTILDYDRVMVMDGGRIAELDSPQRLLADPHSLFASMARDAGIA